MMPAPLTFATKIAAHTQNINIMTSVVVLPLHDMRTYAGEVVVADIFTDGRLMLGIGRGAFAYEMNRLGIQMQDTREIFDESLDVLQALLTQEDVSWNGKYYQFEPITIMPRPVRDISMMMAVMNPEGIYHCTKRGFHIQTTALSGNHQMLVDQVSAFSRAKDEMGEAGAPLTITLSRVAHMAHSAPERQRKLEAAYRYYSRFDNVFTGPGLVDKGMIRELPRDQTMDELGESLLIATPQEMIDKLAPYAELNIDRVILSMNFGLEAQETLDAIQCFAEDVMPHFAGPAQVAAQ